MFAIKTCCTEDRLTVVHLPREISSPTKYLLDKGATIVAKLTSTHHFLKEVLKFPEVKASMPGSIKVHMLLQCYQNMVDELYCQPKEEVVMVSFIEKKIIHICIVFVA